MRLVFVTTVSGHCSYTLQVHVLHLFSLWNYFIQLSLYRNQTQCCKTNISIYKLVLKPISIVDEISLKMTEQGSNIPVNTS